VTNFKIESETYFIVLWTNLDKNVMFDFYIDKVDRKLIKTTTIKPPNNSNLAPIKLITYVPLGSNLNLNSKLLTFKIKN
jgi:hypothetical protein